MDVCKNCKYFRTSDNEWEQPFGQCSNSKFEVGYQAKPKELELDQILVENDEGWAFIVGPEFGCVHYESK